MHAELQPHGGQKKALGASLFFFLKVVFPLSRSLHMQTENFSNVESDALELLFL